MPIRIQNLNLHGTQEHSQNLEKLKQKNKHLSKYAFSYLPRACTASPVCFPSNFNISKSKNHRHPSRTYCSIVDYSVTATINWPACSMYPYPKFYDAETSVRVDFRALRGNRTWVLYQTLCDRPTIGLCHHTAASVLLHKTDQKQTKTAICLAQMKLIHRKSDSSSNFTLYNTVFKK